MIKLGDLIENAIEPSWGKGIVYKYESDGVRAHWEVDTSCRDAEKTKPLDCGNSHGICRTEDIKLIEVTSFRWKNYSESKPLEFSFSKFPLAAYSDGIKIE